MDLPFDSCIFTVVFVSKYSAGRYFLVAGTFSVTDTKHSLFLTSIIVSEKWWSSLSEDLKAKLAQAATNAARLERKWSVEDAEAIAASPVPRKEPALTTPELEEAPGAQELVGQARRDSLLKELMTRDYEFAAKSEADNKTTNELPQGKTSPVGSSQNKITSPVKGTK